MPVLYSAKRFYSAWTVVFLLLFYTASPVYAQSPDVIKIPDVTIVLSEDGGPYLEFSNALQKILASRGVSLRVIDADKPIPDSGLVIGVGVKGATMVAASNAPAILNVFIPKAGYEKLRHDFPLRANSNTFSAIFLDQSVHRQIYLVSAILPDKHKIGLLYSSPPEELEQIRKAVTEQGSSLYEQAVNSSLPLSEALHDILGNSEVLLARPDAVIYNSSTIRNILLATYRSGVPLIGFSSGYVKAGALCAVFSTPAQIATQAAALILQFGDEHVLPAAQYPREFEVMINEQVARSLGLQIKGASVLHDEIKAEMRRAP